MNSMTGYGSTNGAVGKGTVVVEIKSVNHRFFEINARIPWRMSAIEPLIRKKISKKFVRGKFDVFIKEKTPVVSGVKVSIDKDMSRRYLRVLRELKKELHLKDDINFFSNVGLDRLLRVEEKELSSDKIWRAISKLIDKASDGVAKMRFDEGKYIKADQKKRLALMKGIINRIQKRSDTKRKRNIKKRSKDSTVIAGNNDTAVFDDRGSRQDVSEEIVRLRSHIEQYEEITNKKGAIGRKLDFLLQEMNREINTIGSKSSDIAISRMVVDYKAELERLREQMQNIE